MSRNDEIHIDGKAVLKKVNQFCNWLTDDMFRLFIAVTIVVIALVFIIASATNAKVDDMVANPPTALQNAPLVNGPDWTR